jgi:hypothetical protein
VGQTQKVLNEYLARKVVRAVQIIPPLIEMIWAVT